MESKELTIVVVTFKSDKKIISCLNSISNEIPIIIVENSNNFDFKKNIESKFKNVNCILTGGNKGYSVANNIGLKTVKSKYALVLNPDTTLDKNAIKNFFAFIKLKKDFCLLGPANDQIAEIDFKENKIQEVNNLKGFAIFFNMSKFDKEFFDENFFLYFEEIDLCKRLRENNYKIYVNTKAKIFHKAAKSSNIGFEFEKCRHWHWMWSSVYYKKKHSDYLEVLINFVPLVFTSVLKMIFYALIFQKKKIVINYMRFSGTLNALVGKNSWYRPN